MMNKLTNRKRIELIMMNYDEIIKHLSEVEASFSRRTSWTLDPMEQAISQLPQKTHQSIQTVGTKGKGTTSFFLAKLLHAHGYKAGLFTSPYLLDIKEQIQTNFKWISEAEFSALYNDLLPLMEENNLSYFERITIMAYMHFEQSQMDYVVYETGLGGRYDSVSAIKHQMAAFVKMGLDHQEYLGDTIQEIVTEKLAVLENIQNAWSLIPLDETKHLYPHHVKISKMPEGVNVSKEGTEFQYQDMKLFIPMIGAHYAEDAMLALNIVSDLLEDQFNMEAAKTALQTAKWPARLEFIQHNEREFILSSAHTLDSIKADLTAMIEVGIPENLQILLGTSRDRNIIEFADLITELTSIEPFYMPNETYDLPEQRIINQLDAFLNSKNPLLVIGSVYLCGDVLKIIQDF